MKDANEFKQSQLPKQEEAIFSAIAVAEGTPNPVIEEPFFIYPEVEKKLNEANWKVLGTCQCTYNGRVFMYTHLCPADVNERKGTNKTFDGEKGTSYFQRAGDL